jgi:transposase
LTVEPHLPPEELERRYRAAADPIERTHWQIVWLVAAGRGCARAAEVVGYSVDWVREVVRRYNADGPAGLGDRRRANPGGAPLLDAAGRAALAEALAGPAPDGGLWSGAAVARWLGERLGRAVAPQRGWEWLRRLGYAPRRPRPRHAQADPAAQEAFKKGGSPPGRRRSGSPTPGPPSRSGPPTSTGSA